MTFLPPRIKRADTPENRFLRYVEKGDRCWRWDGQLNSKGYGVFCTDGRKVIAHRASYALFRGPITDGLNVLHECDIRDCVNPSHLRLGTQAENVADMMAKGRHVASRGSACGAAKLNENEVRSIRTEEGPAWKVAARYGVSKSLILAIRKGRVWRHLA